jgi:TLC ATP/ADP transporter
MRLLCRSCKFKKTPHAFFFVGLFLILLGHQSAALRLIPNTRTNRKRQVRQHSAKTLSLSPAGNNIRGGEQQAETEEQLEMTAINATTSANATATATIATAGEEHALVKLRKAVFPIYGQEIQKFLLISAIKFFIILALTLTRDTKDTLVVTQCGAEAIAFLKVRIVPCTIPNHILYPMI